MINQLIVIPVLNEENRLPDFLPTLADFKQSVLFVDDGSRDKSKELISNAGFQCYSFKINQGLGAVYRLAISLAHDRKISKLIFMDGDGQHEAKYLYDFIKKLDHAVYVGGNRFENTYGVPDKKLASNFFAIQLSNSIFKNILLDVSCGFKGIRCDIFKPVIQKSYGFEVIYDILFDLQAQNLPISFINMPAIYYEDAEKGTRVTELKAFLNAAKRYSKEIIVKEIIEKINCGNNFELNIDSFRFNATNKGDGYYSFETDRKLAEIHLAKLNRIYRERNESN